MIKISDRITKVVALLFKVTILSNRPNPLRDNVFPFQTTCRS